MYLVHTIGAIGDVPIVHAPPDDKPSTVDVAALVGLGLGGVAVGALGFWLVARYTKGKR